MKTEQIIEGNRLIAEFMGLKIGDGLGKLTVVWRGQYCTPKYHTSWDWLKPVIDKIHETASDDTIAFGGHVIFEYGIGVSIDDAWKAVVQFIKASKIQTQI